MKGFTMLPSYYEALRPLPDDMRLQMYDAVFDYAFEGKEPDNLPPLLNGYFILLRPNLDSSIKHYAASVENGNKGGRPPKKPEKNPEKTQSKPKKNPIKTQEEPNKNRERETETDKETDKETENNNPPAADSPKDREPTKKEYGEYGWVRLTDEEYRRLADDFGQAERDRCITYVDESAQSTGNKNHWKDWNLVIRRCHRDKWGRNTSASFNDRNRVKTPEDYDNEHSFLDDWRK